MKDVMIAFGSAHEISSTLWTPQAAGALAANIGSAIMAASFVLLCVLACTSEQGRASARRMGRWTAPASIGIGMLIYLTTPTAAEARRVYPHHFIFHQLETAAWTAWQESTEPLKKETTSRQPSAADIRPRLEVLSKDIFTGRQADAIQEIDAPGGYIVRDGKDGPEVVFFDAIGSEHIIAIKSN
jgi:hypothetical protein